MIDRSVIASMTVGSGVGTAGWIETVLRDAERNAAAIVRKAIRPALGDTWREFLTDALVAAQLAAFAIDYDHDLGGVGEIAADLVRQVAEVAAQTAADDVHRIIVGDTPSAIW